MARLPSNVTSGSLLGASQADLAGPLRLLRQGQPRQAIAAGRELTRTYQSDPCAWRVRSEVALHAGEVREATECGQKALDLDPVGVASLIQLGRCLAQSGERGRALELADRAALCNPSEALLLDGLGAIYSLADEPLKALPYFQSAAMREPGNAQLLTNLAACERMLGELAAAEASCNRALAADSRAYQACYIRADLKHWTMANNNIAPLEAALRAGGVTWRDEKFLRFALAKEYEDLGNFPAAFEHLNAGNSLQRSHMRYDVTEDIAVIDKIISSHTVYGLRATLAGYESTEPIFVTGLPRTGTSLVDRIIGAHSAAYAAGELNDFALALIETARNAKAFSWVSKPALVERSLSLDMRALGQRYVERTRPRTGHTPRFVDKLPGNYLYCGLIHAALPRAKIILLDRDPMDACFAIYKTLFTGTYPFSYDLRDLGRYYLAYRRLADHWVECLGGNVLRVTYEELVEDVERQAQRILDFCGLPCEPACVDFNQKLAAATTASAVQVRQPIYRSSVGKWRAFRPQLEPLLQMLRADGIAVA